MKAVVFEKYGPPDVLQIKDLEKPTPKNNELQIKVYAASLNVEDLDFLRGRAWSARFLGPLKPKHKVLGFDIAGRFLPPTRSLLIEIASQDQLVPFARYIYR
jgi:NADPH:quinone reductase-like Zn-dependent oxidoreductase